MRRKDLVQSTRFTRVRHSFATVHGRHSTRQHWIIHQNYAHWHLPVSAPHRCVLVPQERPHAGRRISGSPPFIRSHPVMPSRDANPLPSSSRRPCRVRRRLDPLPYTDACLHDLRDGVLVPVAGWRRGLTRGNGALNLAATHAVVRRACVIVPRRAGLRLCAPEPAWHADVAPLHQSTRIQRAASCELSWLSCPCGAPPCERGGQVAWSSHGAGADQGDTQVRACAAAMNSLGMVPSDILQSSPCPSSATPSAPLQQASPQSLSWLLGWKPKVPRTFLRKRGTVCFSFENAWSRVHRGDGEQGPRVGAQGRFQHQPEARRFWGERDARCLLPTASPPAGS
jgi:hypothetical protein